MGAAAQRAISSLHGAQASHSGAAGEGFRRASSQPNSQHAHPSNEDAQAEGAVSNRDPRLGRNNPAWRRLRLEEVERQRQRQRELQEEQEAAAALTDEVDIYREVPPLCHPAPCCKQRLRARACAHALTCSVVRAPGVTAAPARCLLWKRRQRGAARSLGMGTRPAPPRRRCL